MVRIVASSWAQLVGKQDWNRERKCPVLKNVTGGFLSVWLNLDWSALCWTLNHLNQARAGTGWVSASFWMLSLGFLLPECSAAAEMRHAWVSSPQSQAMTREGPRLGKLRITSASWGYRIASRTLSLPSACALPCCPRQDKIETGLSGIQTVKDDEEGGKGGRKQTEEYRRCSWGKQNQRDCWGRRGDINEEKGRMERRDTEVRWLEKHVAVKLVLNPQK